MDLIAARIEFLDKAVGMEAVNAMFKALNAHGMPAAIEKAGIGYRANYVDTGTDRGIIELNFREFDDSKHRFVILTVLDEKSAANPKVTDLFLLYYNCNWDYHEMNTMNGYKVLVPSRIEITQILAHNDEIVITIENVLFEPKCGHPYLMVANTSQRQLQPLE